MKIMVKQRKKLKIWTRSEIWLYPYDRSITNFAKIVGKFELIVWNSQFLRVFEVSCGRIYEYSRLQWTRPANMSKNDLIRSFWEVSLRTNMDIRTSYLANPWIHAFCEENLRMYVSTGNKKSECLCYVRENSNCCWN